MSNGMSACAQGVRGVVIALYRLVLFCHIKLGLLNKRVSMQPPAPKHKAWGKRQGLIWKLKPPCAKPSKYLVREMALALVILIMTPVISSLALAGSFCGQSYYSFGPRCGFASVEEAGLWSFNYDFPTGMSGMYRVEYDGLRYTAGNCNTYFPNASCSTGIYWRYVVRDFWGPGQDNHVTTGYSM